MTTPTEDISNLEKKFSNSLILDKKKDGKLQLIHSFINIVSIMNKKAYQLPTMKVVKLQHKNHILSDSVNDVQTVGVFLKYGGSGGDNQANSRGGGEWDDEEDW